MVSHSSETDAWFFLKKLVLQQKKDLWVVLIYAVWVGLLSLATPIAVQAFVANIAFTSLLQPIVVLSFMVFAGLVWVGILRALQFFVVEVIQQRFFVQIASQLLRRLLKIHPEYVKKEYLPEQINRFLDVVSLQKATAGLLLDGIGLVLQTCIGLILLAFYHPFFLGFDLLLIGMIALVILGLGRGAILSSIQESKEKYHVHAFLEEVAFHPIGWKFYDAVSYAEAQLTHRVAQYIAARRRHYHILFRQIVGSLVFQACMSAILLAMGGYLVVLRQLTIGQLVAAELIVSSIVYGLAKFGKHLESFYDLMAALDKLGHLLTFPVEKQSGESLLLPATDHSSLTLRIEDLSELGNTLLLSPLTLSVQSKEIKGIYFPPSFSFAKLELLELLLGFSSMRVEQKPNGKIFWNQQAVSQILPTSLREKVACFSRHPLWVRVSIRDNLTLGKKNISLESLYDGLNRVGLLNIIQSLPEGLDTFIFAENIKNIPFFYERLEWVRVFLSNASFFILEDPFLGMSSSLRKQLWDDVLQEKKQAGVLLLVSSLDDIPDLPDFYFPFGSPKEIGAGK